MQEFNLKDYEDIKRRKEKLEDRIRRDVPGSNDVKTAKRLLERVSKRLLEYERTHDIPAELKRDVKDDYNCSRSKSYWNYQQQTQSTTFRNEWNPDERNLNFKWHVHFEDDRYHAETRTDDELLRDIGVLYLIFGSTYQTYLNYHVYKIRFLKQVDKEGAFMRVKVNVYEDDILICREVVIGFWAFHYGDDFVGDMECSTYTSSSMLKYDNGSWAYLQKIMDEMKDMWNSYFDEAKMPLMLGMNVAGYIGDGRRAEELDISLTEEQRLEVIKRVEKELMASEWRPRGAVTYWLNVYKPYSDLEDLLTLSGIVYQVTKSGVFIWNEDRKSYWKLVGIDGYTKKMGGHYVLYLLPDLPF